MKKILLVFILGMFLISNVSALEVLKPAKLNQKYTITQTCATCTYVNISIANLDGVLVNNVEMSDNGSGVWVYDYTPTILGRHDIIGKGDLEGTDTSFATYFEVTGTGYELNEQKAIVYLGLLALLVFLFVVNIGAISLLPSKDNRDEEGTLISINQLKYVRPILIVVGWFLLMSIIFISSNIALAYLGTTLMGNLLFDIFQIMMLLSPVMLILWFIYIFYNIFQDREMKKYLERGFEE